ncbi:MAG: hypothetical protein ACRDGU_09735 [Actinomycetota bacterium]
MTRALLPEERAILAFLLSKQFPGREELLVQLEHTRVTGPSCNCGCDSIGLVVDRTVPPAPVDERVPTDAFGRDSAGAEVGALLHVIDGYMDDLEFYSVSDAQQFGRPTLDSLQLAQWSKKDIRGTAALLNRPPPDDGSAE